jgi:hypothetical protein
VQYVDSTIAETFSEVASVEKAKGIWKRMFKPKKRN